MTSLSLFTFMHWRRKWQPTPVFLPGESQGWRSLVGCRLWGHTESDTSEVTRQQQQEQPWHSNLSPELTPVFSGFEKLLNGDIKLFQNIILNTSFTAPQTTLPIVFFRSEHGTPFLPGRLPRPSLLSFRPHLPLRQARTVPSGLQR